MIQHMLLLSLLCATVARGVEHGEEEGHPRDAFYRNARLGKGINLGNALEAPEEGAWGVRLEAKYFDLIAKAGFDSVRIPARWSAHAGEASPYAIEKAFFDRVDWAVEEALSRKLVAVINIHHYEEMTTAPEEHRERLLALWKQIAEHYRDHPATLYFEVLNEPCKELTNDLWNEYLDDVIPLIRKSNPTRALIVGPGQWNNLSALGHLEVPRGDRHVIVTYHYYNPFQFTHQGARWVGPQSEAWLGTTWTGTDEQKSELVKDLDQAVRWAKKNQVPLYMGEFGAYSTADVASRVKWTTFLRSEAEKRDISWAYWEFCAGFGVYDQDKQAWREDLLKALIPGDGTD